MDEPLPRPSPESAPPPRTSDVVEIPVPPQRPPPPPQEPLAESEVATAFWNPVRAIDVVLASPGRLKENLAQSRGLTVLAVLMMITAALFALPFGFVMGVDAWWKIAVFYLGSTLICLPSLYVFSAYLGFGSSLSRIAVLALTIPASAAVFTAGFAPILAFVKHTFDVGSKQVSWQDVSVVLLWTSLFAGLVQLWRCLRTPSIDTHLVLFVILWIAWHGVFLFVLARMGHVLGLVS